MIDIAYLLSVLKAATGTLKVAKLAVKCAVSISALCGVKVNLLSLPDEDFMFMINRLSVVSRRVYYPLTPEEAQNCRSLCNLGVFRTAGGGYKLTWANRCLA